MKTFTNRGRGSGKTLALSLIAIGTALRDGDTWIVFTDHEHPKTMEHADFIKRSLKQQIKNLRLSNFEVRRRGLTIRLRFNWSKVQANLAALIKGF